MSILPTSRRWLLAAAAIATLPVLGVVAGSAILADAAEPKAFTTEFHAEDCEWESRGDNPYFILRPGAVHHYEGIEDGVEVLLTVEVTDETRPVAGVQTRVVEETHVEDGELVEFSRNFFAVCDNNGAVFYFGEEVDIYEGGEIVSHDGAWLAGEDGARPGVIMPGLPLIGARYYQEIAPGAAEDRAVITSLDETVNTPAGNFSGAMKVVETSPLEPGVRSKKWYAYGVGLLQDGPVKLVSYELP